jgi:P2-related tail formation protein
MVVAAQHGKPPTAAYVADIMAEVDRVKPVRAHYTFTQGFSMQGTQAIGAGAQVALYRRLALTDS